jgi:hypothetical protein
MAFAFHSRGPGPARPRPERPRYLEGPQAPMPPEGREQSVHRHPTGPLGMSAEQAPGRLLGYARALLDHEIARRRVALTNPNLICSLTGS